MAGGETLLRLRLLAIAVVTGLLSQFCVNYGDCAVPVAGIAAATVETMAVVAG
jgi:hypothetical protein